MRWIISTALLLPACYSPELGPCTVHCGPTSPCPNDLECHADQRCHAPDDTHVCPHDFLVKIEKAGTGTGVVSGSLGIDCGTTCTSSAAPAASATFMAIEDPSSRFAGWSGACSGIDLCQLTIDSDKTVGATFNLSRTLFVAFVGGGGGTVTSTPVGIDCTIDCSAPFDSGAIVMLTATPDGVSTFIGWESGPCTGMGGCTVTLSSDQQVTAHFE